MVPWCWKSLSCLARQQQRRSSLVPAGFWRLSVYTYGYIPVHSMLASVIAVPLALDRSIVLVLAYVCIM